MAWHHGAFWASLVMLRAAGGIASNNTTRGFFGIVNSYLRQATKAPGDHLLTRP